MQNQHGGNIYIYQNDMLDFSANINPYGIPLEVKQAMRNAIDDCIHYPDPYATKLRNELANTYSLKPEQFFCSNGAAEIFYRLSNALRPENALITAPTFSEYEQALSSTGCNIKHYMLNESQNFCVTSSILDLLNNIDICILCNPNNPTGIVIEPCLMDKIICKCNENNIWLVIDECFIDFLTDEQKYSVLNKISDFNKLIVVRAFTKMFAVAGVRLGWCACSDTKVIERLYLAGQTWNTSVIAQACGVASLKLTDYPKQTAINIKQLREKLFNDLSKLNFKVYNGMANYLLFYTDDFKLHEKLIKHNILIRNCDNYLGLGKGYYRVAVRSEQENNILTSAIKEVL